MASIPVEILFGIYLGVLTGIIPGLVSWSLGFVFKYFTGVTIPGFGVVVLAVALAGVNGGLLALADPTITESANAVTVTTAVLVVLMISLYAHNRGDAMGMTFPKRLTWRQLRERTLSTDVLGSLADREEVRIRIVGEVADMEGYPPLPDDLRDDIRHTEWTFPADLRVSEIEERLANRLRTEYDLGDAAVTVDEGGRASVVAAPSFSGLSKRVPAGERAVSVDSLLPTGLARNDEVRLRTPDGHVRGTVLSAKSHDAVTAAGSSADTRHQAADGTASGDTGGPGDGAPSAAGATNGARTATGEGGADGDSPPTVRAPTTTGGEGRLTVAVSQSDAGPLLEADRARTVVESRGVRREFELVSLLRRAGRRFRRVTVAAGGTTGGTAVDGPLDVATCRDEFGVAVMAIRDGGGWVLTPDAGTALAGGEEVFAVGTRDQLDAFEEAVA